MSYWAVLESVEAWNWHRVQCLSTENLVLRMKRHIHPPNVIFSGTKVVVGSGLGHVMNT